MFSKLAPMTAATAVGLVASIAGAQVPAVQWRVEDGGNGHWYGDDNRPGFATFAARQAAYEAMGAHLATVSSAAEHAFIISVAFPSGQILPSDTWPALGGHKPSNSMDWAWVTGEPFEYSPFSPDPPQFEQEQYLMMWGQGFTPLLWWTGNGNPTLQRSIIEWSADCNADGIVDYGQCVNGTLPDFNGNNIPDCCERNEACVVGNYPVQWRVADGGNSHWFQRKAIPGGGSFSAIRLMAIGIGGDLASIHSIAQDQFVRAVASPFMVHQGALIGTRTPEGCSNFAWSDGSPWDFSAWASGQPNCKIGDGVGYYPDGWHDLYDYHVASYVVEWSADCNSDGIVDYGQILTGQLADTNANGIPDLCEQPTCADADLFRDFTVNGADLGILLSQWGPNTPLTVSDLNADGTVDGADLGLLLSFWGPCAP